MTQATLQHCNAQLAANWAGDPVIERTLNANLSILGTLTTTGNVTVNTDKFTVVAASGNTVVKGTLSANGNLAVNTNKFTVAAASGDTATKGTLTVGAFSSATIGSGIALTPTVTNAAAVYADDGNVALTTGNAVRSFAARTLIKHAQTGDVSFFGAQGQVKNVGALTHSGHVAGLCGYAEFASGASNTGRVSGVYAMCDVPNGATIGAGGVVSGVLIGSNDLTGTHTGTAAAVQVANPVAGLFDALLEIGSATGCTTDTGLTGGTSKHLKIRIGGVDYTIEAKCAA